MARLETKHLDLGDISIAYREYGTGPDLLLLHGNSGSKSMYASYQREQFRDFHTWAVDSRCHGQSRSTDTSLTIGQIADDIVRFCRKQGIRRAFVIGYSDGGNIALFLASRAPELFPRIVAVSPNYLVSGTTEEGLRLFRAMRKTAVTLGRLGFNTSKQIMRCDLMLRDIGIAEEELRGIRTRMQILHAEKDLIKEDHIRRLAELIPGACLAKIRNCTHLSIHGKTEAVKTMREFLLQDLPTVSPPPVCP